MLFIIGANGVPSVASMVNVQAQFAADGRAHAARERCDVLVAGHGGLRAPTASDSDGTVAKVEFFNGTTKLGQDTTAPYGFTWSGVAHPVPTR